MATFAVTTAHGPAWDRARDIRQQPGWDEHAAFADQLVELGVIVLGGPIDGGPEEVALLAMQAADAAQVRSIFSVDPWVVSGVLRVKDVRQWRWWLDSR
jgi:uncharacterized protein YciI